MRTMSSVDPRVRSWMETLLQDVLSEEELDRLPAIAQEMLSDAIRPIKCGCCCRPLSLLSA